MKNEEFKTKCPGCGKMMTPVISISENGKVGEFCSYKCFEKVEK